MLDRLILWSIRNRLVVVVLAVLLTVYGGTQAVQMPVDVFPDLNRPTVSILTESHGLAPEEVETLINLPLESALNGATGVERVRSVAGIGLSILWVEFDWNTDIFVARQIVNEKVSAVRGRLPRGSEPVLAPISSIMGEIMLVGLTSRTGATSPMELRSLADWRLRPRLMAVPGVSQVIVIGGEVRQYQVLLDPERMLHNQVSVAQVEQALSQGNQNTSGGFLDRQGQEALVRNLGRIANLPDLARLVVDYRPEGPVRLDQVGSVRFGPQIRRGAASVSARPGVILSVQKQPGANTLELTGRLQTMLAEAGRESLPADVALTPLFEQSHFIRAAVTNVEEALRDGALMVVLVLFAFLLNLRTTLITLTAIPLSLVVATLTMQHLGLTINTMTLGGLCVAVGELVDDAIVDVENVFRRLSENRRKPQPENAERVVFRASSEVRNSIVYSTLLIVLVFLPLFFLGGIEGRLFQPLGIAYVVALVASLLVSVTLTPALCTYLLASARWLGQKAESPLAAWLKRLQERVLRRTLRHPVLVLGLCLLAFLLALASLATRGREFLPPFNEGTLTVSLITEPGTSLNESDRIGRAAERVLLAIPEVRVTGRRTGRAELDEHAEGVHYSELDVDLRAGRGRDQILADVRKGFGPFPGVEVNLGQPISHRLDHILSGIRSQVAVKVFGPDLATLRKLGDEVRSTMAGVSGVVDLAVEKQVLIPQLRIQVDPVRAGEYGLTPGELSSTLEIALGGEPLGQVVEGQQVYDLVLRLDEPFRDRPESIRRLLIDSPAGLVPLGAVADVEEEQGPNQIMRENMLRRIVVQCNVAGRDLGSTVDEIRRRLERLELPPGYHYTLEGQFQSQQSASATLLGFSLVSLVAIYVLLYQHFRMHRLVLMVLAAVPLAVTGGALALTLTGQNLSVASLVGFITLCGISSRNEIMRLSHYLHLMEKEGMPFGLELVLRGSRERLIPVMMTALSAGLALIPLAASAGAPGKEILQPVAVVILGGLLVSTLLETVVTPILFWTFGAPVAGRNPHHDKGESS
ncbi:efflux RND transporter permease subunit [bacterium CPR1]|nr:efflux RND transporter permease subunit [bacterium CPR1]